MTRRRETCYPKRGLTLCGFRADIETDGFSAFFGDDEFVPREGQNPPFRMVHTPLRKFTQAAAQPGPMWHPSVWISKASNSFAT